MPPDQLPRLLKAKIKHVTTLPTRAASSRSVEEELPYGLLTLFEGDSPVVDIVAVHGLDGHREKSWTVGPVNWLRDFLPKEIPNARIMSWGYDARTHSFSQIGGKYIYDHGTTLISDLCLKRASTKTLRRPIVFVAHSLGGIVLKSALIHSEAARKGALEEHRSIKLSTYGILFMGSPSQGAVGVQLGEIVLRIASIFMTTNNKVVKHIQRDSEWLQQQLRQYAPISQDFVTKFAYETCPTTSIALGKKVMIVPQASAVVPGTTDGEPIAIAADHVNMVKFASRQDVGYEKVSNHLQLIAAKAPNIIHARWDEQDRIEDVLTSKTDDFSMPFSLYGVPEIEEFVGRDEELSKMKEVFSSDGSERTVLVLQGLGGMGKTQLAVKYLKEHKNAYSAIFWLNGRTEDTLKQSFAVMAKRLHSEHASSVLVKRATEAKDVDEVVKSIRQWLSIKANCRWILVFDNIDNPKIPGNKDPQAYDIKLYFPEAYHGSIIITTRSSRLKLGSVIPIRKLRDVQDGISILSANSGRPNLDQDPHAKELVEKLDGLPLALATAGAYLSQGAMSLEKYLGHYADSWLKLQKTSPELLPYEDRTLYTTWNLSFEKIQSQNGLAAQLLRLWAYFDNQDVWYELLAAGRERCPEWFSSIVDDELSFNMVIGLLCDHALIEPVEVLGNSSGGYSMHSCVHAWVKHVLNEKKEPQLRRIVLACLSCYAPWTEDPQYWAKGRRLLPHAHEFLDVMRGDVETSAQESEDYWRDAFQIGFLFAEHEKLKEAGLAFRLCLDNLNKLLGPEHSLTLLTVHNLGRVRYSQGYLNEAETLYQSALHGQEKAIGVNHPETLITASSLGGLFAFQAKWNEAEALYQRVLDGREKILGPDHPLTLGTVLDLGLHFVHQGKLEEAEVMQQRALTGLEKVLGPERVITLKTVKYRGILYFRQGKLAEAEVMLQRALDGQEKLLGHQHPEILGTVHSLGDLYMARGKLVEAETMLRRALEGKEKSLGPGNLRTLSIVHSLGSLFTWQGKLKEAETMLQRVVEARLRVLGPRHPDTLGAVNDLGSLAVQQGKFQEAEDIFQRVIIVKKKVFGPDHSSTVDTMYCLGELYAKQGKFDDAEDMFGRALEGYTKVLGPDHPYTLETISELAALYDNRAKSADV